MVFVLPDENIVHVLAFVGGYVDASGFLKLQSVFTSSITGNLVVAAASTLSVHGVLCRSMVTLSFTFSAALGCILAVYLRISHKLNPKLVSVVLFSLEVAMLIISWVLGEEYLDIINTTTDVDNWAVILVATMYASSMGFQCIAAKETISNCPATTVMTNTLVNVAALGSSALGYYIALVSATMGIKPKPDQAYHRVEAGEAPGSEVALPVPTVEEAEELAHVKQIHDKYVDFLAKFLVAVKPLVFFLAGAVIGAVITDHIHFHALCVPVVLTAGVVLDQYLKTIVAKSSDAKTAPPPPAPSPSPSPCNTAPTQADDAVCPIVEMVAISAAEERDLKDLDDSLDDILNEKGTHLQSFE